MTIEKWWDMLGSKIALGFHKRVVGEKDSGEILADYVERRIHEVFLEVAEMVNNAMMSEEGIPLKLFQGETLLIRVWKQYMERELK